MKQSSTGTKNSTKCTESQQKEAHKQNMNRPVRRYMGD